MQGQKKIIITFDVEEFDLPLEFKGTIETADQLSEGYKGLEEISSLLDQPGFAATLFTTGFFAENFSSAIKQLSDKHEIASHSYFHSSFEEDDLIKSKKLLEIITGKLIEGIRIPRMKKVAAEKIKAAGYSYNSSINPTWIPGRYNNRNLPRHPFMEGQVLQFPVSVTPNLRIPLFWLSFKNMPYSLYIQLAKQTLKKDGYLSLYFHPWEFIDLSRYKLPFYLTKGYNKTLLRKVKRLIYDLSSEGEFITMNQFIKQQGNVISE